MAAVALAVALLVPSVCIDDRPCFPLGFRGASQLLSYNRSEHSIHRFQKPSVKRVHPGEKGRHETARWFFNKHTAAEMGPWNLCLWSRMRAS